MFFRSINEIPTLRTLKLPAHCNMILEVFLALAPTLNHVKLLIIDYHLYSDIDRPETVWSKQELQMFPRLYKVVDKNISTIVILGKGGLERVQIQPISQSDLIAIEKYRFQAEFDIDIMHNFFRD